MGESMTKERALEVLQDLLDDLDDDEGYGEGDKDYEDTMFALEWAISLVERELKADGKETCEDCVSRHAVGEMIKAEMPERGMWEIEGDKEKETVCEVCVDLMQKLSALPPVTPQKKC